MGDSLGLRAAFQVTAKLPWKWATGCNCRNNPIPALSQPGLWAEEVKLENAPLRLKKISLMVELLKPFGMATLKSCKNIILTWRPGHLPACYQM